MLTVFDATVGHVSKVTVHLIILEEIPLWIENTEMFHRDFDIQDMELTAYRDPPTRRQSERIPVWSGRILKNLRESKEKLEGMDEFLQFLASEDARSVQYIEAWEAGQRRVHAAHIISYRG